MIYLWNIKYQFFKGRFGSSYQIKYASPAKNIKIITPAPDRVNVFISITKYYNTMYCTLYLPYDLLYDLRCQLGAAIF